MGLNMPKDSYRSMSVVAFSPLLGGKQVVEAEWDENRKEYIFTDSCRQHEYSWVADLKRRRALRTAQNLAQKLGRLGFDEFEPYRK